MFGRSESYLSTIFLTVCEHLANTWRTNLEWHQQLRHYDKLIQFTRAIDTAGAGTRGLIWGFIDGHFQPFGRPQDDPQLYYSHKEHGMKFQAITTPDGLVSSLVGPFEGSINDCEMYTTSRIPVRLKRMIEKPGRRPIHLYGDAVYADFDGCTAPFTHSRDHRYLGVDTREFDRLLSSIRISAEHSFGDTTNGGYNAHGMQLRVGKQPVGCFFITAVLLANCWNCMNRNQTSRKYDMEPPELEAYLALPQRPTDNQSQLAAT